MEFGTNDSEEFSGEEPQRHPTWAEQQETETTPTENQPRATSGAEAAALPLDSDPVEVFELLDNGPKKSPKLKKMLTAGAAVAVLGVGSIVAVNQFQSSDGTAGGAETPEAVVQEFFDSLGNEDFLGAAETMEPTERRTMVNPGIEMVGELQRLGIIAEEMDLGSVPGMDMQFDDMSYVPQSIGGAGDVVRVKVNGSITARGDVSQLPLGSLITDNVAADELTALTAEGEQAMETSVESIDDLGVVAVQRDGAWYVSLWYSVAEGIRRDSGAEGLPAFGEGPTPTGGESPEDAVWALANAAQNLSVAEMIGALDPQEAAALYDYSNLFLAEAQAELDAQSASIDLAFTRIDMRSETNGDDGQVWVDGFALELSDNGEMIRIDTAAECMVDNISDGFCEVSKSEMDEIGLSTAVLSSSAMQVRRAGDRWYISPMASIMQPMLDEVRGLERAQLQGWIDNPESLFEEGGPVGGLGLFPLAVFGSSATMTFDDVGSQISDEEWIEQGEWEEVPPVPTTAAEFFEDEVPGEAPAGTTTSVPAFTFDSPLPGVDTTVPPSAPESAPSVPSSETTIPSTSTTAAPSVTTTVPASETTVLIFRVLEPAPAGTSAFSILAEPVDVSPEEAASYPGALTEAQAATIEGWVSLTAVEPGDILRYEWFIDE